MIEELYLCTDIPAIKSECSSMRGGKHFLLLRERLYYELPLEITGFTDVFSSYIKRSDYEDIRADITRLWRRVINATDETDLSHYEYHFSHLCTPIFFWSLSIRRAINTLRPKKLWISERISESGMITIDEDLSNYEKLNQWLVERCVLQHCRECGIRTLRYPAHEPALHPVDSQRRRRLEYAIRGIISKADHVLDLISLFYRLRCILHFKRGKHLLMIVQPGKSRRLQRALWKSCVRLQLQSYSYAKKAVGSESFCFQYHYGYTTRGLDAITAWLLTISKHHDQSVDPNIEMFLSRFSNLVVTDAEHDPVVSRINKHIRSGNNRVLLTIPEGGLEPFMSSYSHESLKFEAHERLARCVLSEVSAERLERIGKRGHSLLVLGYDTSLRMSAFMGRLFRLGLKALSRKKKAPIIFYDYPRMVEDIGIVRCNVPADIQIINAMKMISTALDAAEHPVIIHTNYIHLYRKYCKNSFVESWQHWSVNAMCSDIIITSFSSIAVECLSIGKPVVIWHPYTETTSFFEHLRSNRDCHKIMRIVTRIEDLHGAVSDLLKARKEDFAAAQKFVPRSNHDQVAKEIYSLMRDLDANSSLT